MTVGSLTSPVVSTNHMLALLWPVALPGEQAHSTGSRGAQRSSEGELGDRKVRRRKAAHLPRRCHLRVGGRRGLGALGWDGGLGRRVEPPRRVGGVLRLGHLRAEWTEGWRRGHVRRGLASATLPWCGGAVVRRCRGEEVPW